MILDVVKLLRQSLPIPNLDCRNSNDDTPDRRSFQPGQAPKRDPQTAFPPGSPRKYDRTLQFTTQSSAQTALLEPGSRPTMVR
jgi:hypothetical protein